MPSSNFPSGTTSLSTPTTLKPPRTHSTLPAITQLLNMGITDFFSDVWDTFSHPSPDADTDSSSKSGQASTKTPTSGTDEESDAEKEVNKEDAVDDTSSGEQGHKPSG